MSLLTNLPGDVLAQIMLQLPEYTDIWALSCSCKKLNQTLHTYKSFLTKNGYIRCGTRITTDYHNASLLFVRGNEAFELYFYGRREYDFSLKRDPFSVKINNIMDCKNILAYFTGLRISLKTFTNNEWEFTYPKFYFIQGNISWTDMNISNPHMKKHDHDRYSWSRHLFDKKEIESGVDNLRKEYLKYSSGRYLSDYFDKLVFDLLDKMREKPER